MPLSRPYFTGCCDRDEFISRHLVAHDQSRLRESKLVSIKREIRDTIRDMRTHVPIKN
jgi:hypothetical protein